ncbi:PPOX class F420-dependent oxidoreductase [Actinoplanes sp. TFC3]|uniref:PPOX class F420-dependent oxidoreductase n=1 Tax=Actinoplanes sp. TFC3 TaxID=1710355 RepID=UPI0008298427|nr:PPOX class F420-dependent oxidoreductase [Actinoplanes sp. TFC3]
MAVAAEFAKSKQISLTTYRKNGSAVATPVWHVVDGDELVVVSELDAGKVKRLRNSGRVTVAPCDLRGNLAAGASSVEGTARLLDDAGTARARDLLARRYIMSRAGNWFATVFRVRRKPLVGIAIQLS